jgi:hypothetical protein
MYIHASVFNGYINLWTADLATKMYKNSGLLMHVKNSDKSPVNQKRGQG